MSYLLERVPDLMESAKLRPVLSSLIAFLLIFTGLNLGAKSEADVGSCVSWLGMRPSYDDAFPSMADWEDLLGCEIQTQGVDLQGRGTVTGTDGWAWQASRGVPDGDVPDGPAKLNVIWDLPSAATLAEVAAGVWDTEIEAVAQNLLDQGRGDSVLRLFHEADCCNRHWTFRPSMGGDPDDFKNAWRRVHDVVMALPGADFEWEYQVDGPGSNPTPFMENGLPLIELGYPGDAYVDTITTSLYNRVGTDSATVWADKKAKMDYVLAFARSHGKTFGSPEWGLWVNGASGKAAPGDDPSFIQNVVDYFAALPAEDRGTLEYFHIKGRFGDACWSDLSCFPESMALFHDLFVKCTVTVLSEHVGPLTVASGITCVREGATVTGPVSVQPGARLVVTGGTVIGPVRSEGAHTLRLVDSQITGPVSIIDSTRWVTVQGNRMTGPVSLTGSDTGTTPIVTAGNQIMGPLSCSENQPAPTDNGMANTVTGPASGQCGPDTEPPTAPTNLRLQVATSSQVELTWGVSSDDRGVAGYRIWRDGDVAGETTGTGFTDTTVVPGTSYTYTVTAFDRTHNESLPSNPVQVTIPGERPPHVAQRVNGSVVSVDGSLSEPEWNHGGTGLPHVVSQVVGGASDNSGNYSVLWDVQYLYVGVRVSDGSLVDDSAPTTPWQDDSVEVYVDGDHSGGGYSGPSDEQFNKSWGNAGFTALHGSGSDVLRGWSNVAGGYEIEMAIPWSLLQVTPTEQLVIGFDVGVNDDDTGIRRDGQLMAWGTSNNHKDTSDFGDLTLVGAR